MKAIKFLLYSLISVTALCSLLIMLLVTTTTGLKSAIKLIDSTTPIQLTANNLSGSISSGMKFSTISYQDKKQKIQISQGLIKVNILALFKKEIDIERFTANSLLYQRKRQQSSAAVDTKQQSKQTATRAYSFPFTINIDQTSIDNIRLITGSHRYYLDNLSLDATLTKNQLAVEKLSIQHQKWLLSLSGKSLLHAPFTMQWQANMHGYLADGDPVNGNVTTNGDAQLLNIHGQVAAPFQSTWQGQLKQWLSSQGSIQLNGNWQAVNIFFDRYNLQSQKGSLSIDGPLQAYHIAVKTDLAGNRIPKSNWSLQAIGSLSALKFHRIEINTLGGKLSGQALLQWQPTLKWQLSLLGKNIHPGQKWQQWQGKLNFDSQINGQRQGQQWQMHWLMHQLNGDLNKQTVNGQWQLTLIKSSNQTAFDFKNARLNIGKNRFSAQGGFNQLWQLQWKIDAPELEKIYSGLEGSINSNGQLRGNRYHPQTQLILNIHQLDIGALNIDHLDTDVMFNWHQRHDMNVKLDGSNISFRRQSIHLIKIHGRGNSSQQNWQTEIQSSLFNMTAILNGGWVKQQWQGNITKLMLNNPYKATVSLQAPTAIRISRQQASIAPFCLRNANSKLCGQLQWQKQQQFIAKLTAKNISLSVLNAFLPAALSIDAPLDADMDMNSDGNIIKGQAKIVMPYLKISRQTESNDSTLLIKNISLNANADRKGLRGNATINDKMQLAAKFNLPPLNLINIISPDKKLSANLQLKMPDLKTLSTLSSVIDNSGGSFETHLQLSGSLAKPALQGSFSINNGSANIVPLNIQLKNILLKGNINRQNKVSLALSMDSHKGSAKLSGYLHWLSPFASNIHISSQDFTIIDTPEYQATVSSNLNLLYQQPNLTVNGAATVTNAMIKPKDFSNAVSLPDNVRYTDNQQKPLKLYLDINLGLENINIIYQGLNATLGGNLAIKRTPKNLMTASGELNTSKGDYKAYGRQLSLEKGMLSYNNSSIDNPNINIRAVRYINNNAAIQAASSQPTSVGVALGGTLQKPTVSLFANPNTLSQTDILSYILFDHGASSLTAADQSKQQQLLLAASSAGLSKTPIKQKLGLSDFGIESNQIINSDSKKTEQNTSMVLGKQIRPRLSARYSIGLLKPINIIEIIYQLTTHFQLQTDSSSFDNGADIIYTIETD